MISKRWSYFLAIGISLGSIMGCSTVQEPAKTTMNETQQEVVSEQTDHNAQEDKTTRVITDMANREVEIPAEIDKVYGVNNNATYILYTLVPDKMIGWNGKLSDAAKKYILDEYKDLPVLGILYGGGTKASYEEIIGYEPDVIVLSDRSATENVIAAADEIQERIQIPVIIIENGMESYDEAYALLGSIFNVEERAKELSQYYLETYEYAKAHVPKEEDQVRVYYARTEEGLNTDFAGSYHTELLDLIGAKNVAVGEDENSSAQSGTVSLEQVMGWDPEVIITGQMGNSESDVYNVITNDDKWAGIKAVQENKVYPMPNKPFNWFDRPPSVNRIVGIKYLGHLVYPEIYTEDPSTDIKAFFSLFYGYDLTDEEVQELIGIQ